VAGLLFLYKYITFLPVSHSMHFSQNRRGKRSSMRSAVKYVWDEYYSLLAATLNSRKCCSTPQKKLRLLNGLQVRSIDLTWKIEAAVSYPPIPQRPCGTGHSNSPGQEAVPKLAYYSWCRSRQSVSFFGALVDLAAEVCARRCYWANN